MFGRITISTLGMMRTVSVAIDSLDDFFSEEGVFKLLDKCVAGKPEGSIYQDKDTRWDDFLTAVATASDIKIDEASSATECTITTFSYGLALSTNNQLYKYCSMDVQLVIDDAFKEKLKVFN